MDIGIGDLLPEQTDRKIRQPRFRLRITWAIGFGAGLIALLGMAAAAFLVVGGLDTSARLLRLRGLDAVDMLHGQVTHHLEPAAQIVSFLAQRIEAGEIDPADEKALADALVGALAGAPQVKAITYFPATLIGVSAIREEGRVAIRPLNLRLIPGGAQQFADGLSREGPFWGEVIFSAILKQPVLNVRHRVGTDAGLVAVVTLTELSDFVSRVQTGWGAETFILVDGRKVLAHPRLAGAWGPHVESQRLPTIDQIGDPVLAQIWGERVDSWIGRRVLGDGLGHVVQVNGEVYTFIYRELIGFGPQPWVIGQAVPQTEVRPLIDRLYMGVAAAGILLVCALLLAFFIGRWIGQPIVALSDAVEEVRGFNFEGRDLPPSYLSEIDGAARAFNASRAALRWFTMYVPRRLVTRLLAEGEATMASRRRQVTVMFTDIVGFTAMAEELGETETAELLNEHFGMLATCIEDNGGVIDKFMGDAIMATWGAIKKSDSHAADACTAALAIAEAVARHNAMRRAGGEEPVRVRIGLHSGPVVVGNIGSPERINFTVVGDTVNAAQRLEGLGKQFMTPADDALVLVSEETIDAAGMRERGEPVGEHRLTGREETVQVFRLR